jgi:hypothetical protein
MEYNNTIEAYKNLSIEDMPDEIWKPIVGFEGLYEVSNWGRIRNLGHRVGQHASYIIMKQRSNNGYMAIALHKDSKVFTRMVHRLEYEAFVAPIPAWNPKDKGDVKMEINHKDENKANNRLDNLELITKTQNNNYGSRTRRQAAKLTKAVYQYTLDKKFVKFWEGGAPEIFKSGYNKSCISECCRGVQAYYRGFLWSYTPL